VALMVIDTSAIVAILFDEPERPAMVAALESAPVRMLSAVSRVELAFVVEGRKGEAGRFLVEQFLSVTSAEVVAVTPQQAERAIAAFRRFGKGRHRAALNIGDCFSYALAKEAGRPLLFKGDDFRHTDVTPALEHPA
jgi:ribonuclease VapC